MRHDSHFLLFFLEGKGVKVSDAFIAVLDKVSVTEGELANMC